MSQLSLSPGTRLQQWDTEFDTEDFSLPDFFSAFAFFLASPCSSPGAVLSPCAHSSLYLAHDVLTFNWAPFRWEQGSLHLYGPCGTQLFVLNEWMNKRQSELVESWNLVSWNQHRLVARNRHLQSTHPPYASGISCHLMLWILLGRFFSPLPSTNIYRVYPKCETSC